MCRNEAKRLSKLFESFLLEYPEAQGKAKLFSVVHEDIGDEVKAFKEYMSGDVYLDLDKGFYKAIGDRWAGLSSIFSMKMLKNAIESYNDKDVKGNLKGEGRLLGGVLVVPAGAATPAYLHKEAFFGNFAPPAEVKKALCDALRIKYSEAKEKVVVEPATSAKVVCTEDACTRA